MDATSERKKKVPANVPADANVQAAIARLTESSGWEYLRAAVHDARARFFTNLARGIATRREPVDQREIDEKRGFWLGAIWAVETLPTMTSAVYERFVEEAMKEAEALEQRARNNG